MFQHFLLAVTLSSLFEQFTSIFTIGFDFVTGNPVLSAFVFIPVGMLIIGAVMSLIPRSR